MSNYRDYTFSRNDTMLVQRVDGTWERVGANFPCLTYKDDDLGKYRAGAWIPKALTNLAGRSEELDNAYWSKFNLNTTGTPAWVISNGSLIGSNAFRLIPDATNAGHYVFRGNGTAGIDCMAAVVKDAGYRYAYLGNGSNGHYAVFDLQDGTIANASSGATVSGARIVDLGGGYYLIICRVNRGSAYTAVYGVANGPSAFNFVGNNTNGIDFWGLQLYASDVADTLTIFDYVQTLTDSSATRAVTDIRNTSFPLLASLQGFIDVEINNSTVGQQIFMLGLDNGNWVGIQTTVDEIPILYYIDGSTLIWQLNNSNPTIGRYRLSYYISNGLNIFWVDNTEIQRNTGSYAPQGGIKVLGGFITGTTNKLTNGGFINEFCASGMSEAELLDKASFKTITQFANFKRAKFDDEALTTSAITLLQNTEL